MASFSKPPHKPTKQIRARLKVHYTNRHTRKES